MSDTSSVAVQLLMDQSGVRFGTSGMRGLVSAMTPELCFAYTLAFVQALHLPRGQRVAIGMDLRPSSPDIAAASVSALKHAGLIPEFCGVLPTPALAYYAQINRMPAIMITGSHIPFDRNGIKFYGVSGEITKADEAAIAAATVEMPLALPMVPLPAVVPEARAAYIRRYTEFFPASCLGGMRVGFYEHSGAARDLITEILHALGAKVVSLGRTDDFVPIDTEAVSEEDKVRARQWAAASRMDALISTDGDADRPLIGDERGAWMRGDIVGLLTAQFLGIRAIATPVSCNTAIELSGLFECVTRTKIGSPYVIAAMEQLQLSGNAQVAGFEANGGFLLGSELVRAGRTLAPLMTRDAVLPILAVLAMAKERAGRVSALAAKLPARFTASDRIQSFPVELSRALLEQLGEIEAVERFLEFAGSRMASCDRTDGLRLTLQNGEIVHLRPSGNAPELRCYAEADTQERAVWLASEGLRASQVARM